MSHVSGCDGEASLEPSGYRVVNLSTAANVHGLHVLVDYIVEVNGQPVDGSLPLGVLLAGTKGPTAEVMIYNLIENSVRSVGIIRNPMGQFSLGATVRYEYIQEAVENAVKVISVKKDYPGDEAGLVAGDDYLIALGSGETLNGTAPLYKAVQALDPSKLEGVSVYAFSVRESTVRRVELIPRMEPNNRYVLGIELEETSLPLEEIKGQSSTVQPWQLLQSKREIGTQTEELSSQLFQYVMSTNC
ncbi:GRASP55/65 PDZ-like domain protein [Gregarina niphandrodes]|uniref:GRASP55/65 PDZ-like domain protein n=1 Tax=Gregarina niphandrodes TaxID=110365 RepID=A0A023BAB8_GRENI|nr:GRASP55/65 PDZ-like domain protein [Gregarina niphandrodes]EZG78208.1 GRASP55/65 PDZ-like domain protein [Gregarina niphandrodes]|eukprot:XP_011129428.1 GRASP55/65 PDZ-like domain protein [Gregarina niphandrodes]